MRASAIIGRIFIYLIIYFALSYYGGPWGSKLLYPVRLLVTFLHELGHATAALLSGGSVNRIQINPDGSGWTETVNGHRALTIMGGYLGSAIFGNIIFLIGVKFKSLVKPCIALLSLIMVFTAIFWFNSLFTTALLIFFGITIYFIGLKTSWGREFLMFIGLISIIYIIQDFDIGPRSDLDAYAKELIIFSADIWKYVWLFIVILLFLMNLRYLVITERKSRKKTK